MSGLQFDQPAPWEEGLDGSHSQIGWSTTWNAQQQQQQQSKANTEKKSHPHKEKINDKQNKQ